MISYQPLWDLLKKRGLTRYALDRDYPISDSTLRRMKKGKVITLATLNELCKALQCRVEDVIVYIEDKEDG